MCMESSTSSTTHVGFLAPVLFLDASDTNSLVLGGGVKRFQVRVKFVVDVGDEGLHLQYVTV